MFTSALNFLKSLTTSRATDTDDKSYHALALSDDNQAKYNPYKTNSANQNKTDAPGTIKVGMTTAQVVQSLGPALTKQYDGNREIWTYLNLKGQGIRTHIAIQDGVVVNWQDVRPNAAPRFAPSR